MKRFAAAAFAAGLLVACGANLDESHGNEPLSAADLPGSVACAATCAVTVRLPFRDCLVAGTVARDCASTAGMTFRACLGTCERPALPDPPHVPEAPPIEPPADGACQMGCEETATESWRSCVAGGGTMGTCRLNASKGLAACLAACVPARS